MDLYLQYIGHYFSYFQMDEMFYEGKVMKNRILSMNVRECMEIHP